MHFFPNKIIPNCVCCAKFNLGNIYYFFGKTSIFVIYKTNLSTVVLMTFEVIGSGLGFPTYGNFLVTRKS